METKNKQTEVSTNEKKNKSTSFILKHKMVFFLLFLLIVFFLGALIKIKVIEHKFNIQKDNYEMRIDSINVANMKLNTKVLSWAVRSEMTRNNMEQVNQLLLNFVKEPNVNKIELVDPFTFKIILSTDKKDEGQTIADHENINVDQIIFQSNRFLSPIMGLNSKIGILIIELNTQKK